jgi:hypothetical protein
MPSGERRQNGGVEESDMTDIEKPTMVTVVAALAVIQVCEI